MWCILASAFRRSRFNLALIISIMAAGCGGKNVGTSQEDITPEQEAQDAMNEGDYEGAIEILEPVVEDNPKKYKTVLLLASAYAGLAGVDMVSLLKSLLSSDAASENGGVFGMIAGFIPEDEDGTGLEAMEESVGLLQSIPSEKIGSDGDEEYGESAELQLMLYQSIYATMLLNSLIGFDADGNFDPEDLENLTLEDAEAILGFLRSAADTSDSEQAEQFGDAIDETLAEIDAGEGEDDRERLAEYLEQQQQ